MKIVQHFEWKNGNSTNESLKRMIVYIHEHYDRPICVSELADAAYVSKRVCFRLFRENLHMSPVAYMNEYRLRKACQMLTNGERTITEIANQCGLGSGSYFSKLFRERYGCTPLEYRRCRK